MQLEQDTQITLIRKQKGKDQKPKIDQVDAYTTNYLLDNPYFKEDSDRIDLNNQQALDPDPKTT